MHHIIIANVDAFARQLLQAIGEAASDVHVAATVERMSALDAALRGGADVVFLDLTQPEDVFFERFEKWRALAPDAAFILCTKDKVEDHHSTLELIRMGAADRLKIPSQTLGLLHAMDTLEDKTLAKIRRLSRGLAGGKGAGRPSRSSRPSTTTTRTPSTKADFDRAFHRTITRLQATRSKLAHVRSHDDAAALPQQSPAPEHRATLAPTERAPSNVRAAPTVRPPSNVRQPTDVQLAAPPARGASIDLLTIGISTGGPQALHELFTQLTTPLPVPALIVQHMPPNFTKILAQRLNSLTQNTVVEAEHGMVLKPGHVLIAPGDFHMTLARDQTRLSVELSTGEKVNGCRPAVDVLWESIPGTLLGGCLAVIMTGMGKDGLDGARALQDINATVIAQDEATSVIWGMPGAIAQAGLAHSVVGLPELGHEIMKRLARSGGSSRRTTAHTKESDHEVPHRR